jgi:DNA-binding transcriptional LysR family regulator
VLREGALAGIGIAVLPYFLVADDLASGALVELLPQYPIPPFWLKALVPHMKLAKPAVHELVEHLKAHMSPVPPWEKAS